ncbi:MAG TPA: PA domain-containing protein [Nocardioides sp.]|uniref:PA domain-containing protein n=1 Tax=Nocardioides sp. TaxID=35761 RepID=UPI002F3F79B4
MSRTPFAPLAATAAAVALALTGQAANGSTSSFHPAPPAAQARVIDLGGHDRVQLSPVGTSGRTAVLPLEGRAATGVLETTTSSGTQLAPAGGGRPTLVSGTAAVTPDADPGTTVALTFSSIGRDGREAFAHVNIFDLATGSSWSREIPGSPDTGHDCSTDGWAQSDCILLEPGEYSVMAFVTTEPAQTPPTDRGRTAQSVALVGDPQVHLTAARQMTLDARDAHRLTVSTPGHRTRANNEGLLQLGYTQTAADGSAITGTLRPSFLLDNHAYLQPTLEPTVGTFQALTRLQLAVPDISLASRQTGRLHPAYYDAVWFSDFDSEFPMYDGQDRLAAIDVGQARPEDLAGKHLHGAIAVVERSDDLSVAEQSNNAAAAGAGLVAIYNNGPGDNGDPNGTGVKLQVPTVRLDRAEGRALTRLPAGSRVDVRGEPASPYLYDLVIKENGRIPTDLHHSYALGDLATQVRSLHGQPTIGSTFSQAAYQFQPGDTFSISTMMPFRGGPRARTEYRIADPDTAWTYAAVSPGTSYNAMFPHDPVEEMLVSDPHRAAYRPGEVSDLPALTAPITAAPNPGAPVARGGDRMRIYLDGFTDAEGNHGFAYSDASGMATHLEVLADGALVAETDYLPYGYAALPAGNSQVAIHFTTDNPQAWNQLSTHTDTTWSFPSSTTADVENAPVLVPDYDVPVDLRNRVTPEPGRRAVFDLAIPHAAGSSDTRVGDVKLDASWDDGKTWTPASVTPTDSGWHVVLPRGGGFVSLRLHAADDAGSAVDQTVVRAFLVR